MSGTSKNGSLSADRGIFHSTAAGSFVLFFPDKHIKRDDSPQQKSPADFIQDDGQLPWNCFSDPLGHISDFSDTTVVFHSVGVIAFATTS